MSIVLLRVDERLIHGQVVVGWGEPLHIDRIIVVDDELADSAWEQELYRLGVTSDIAAEFHTLAAARDRWHDWEAAATRTVVLVRELDPLISLAEAGLLDDEEVNLGGIHFAEGRDRFLPYLFLGPDEVAALQRIAASGVRVSARDLPAAKRVPLNELLRPT